ncbi:hypothetical protein SAMN04487967_1893 [Natronorubrum sediminis]|uniref:Uncharacterized protein n=1 Tax=Natronorubrum sediminis TaxID=640943 RepID=A0A1H6FXN7_9EURY|nr:hypothetical protein [Natronorubrum sediminis]SEH15040.1 hypothetical protein SAMN04487967_1893 [Natronorubrum sediminis]
MGVKDRNINPDEFASIDSFGNPDTDTDGTEETDTDSDRGSHIIAAGVDDPVAVTEAAVSAFGVDWEGGIDSGVADSINEHDVTAFGENGRAVVCGSDRDATRAKLLHVVQSSDARDKVVLTDWLAYCEDLGDLSSFLRALLNAESAVTAVGSDVLLSPGGSVNDPDLIDLLGEIAAASLDPRDIPDIEVLREDWEGRTPIGTEVSMAGNLCPSDDWNRVRKHLLDVVEGEVSQRFAAKRIGCAPRTVARILNDPERRELYRLPAASDTEE